MKSEATFSKPFSSVEFLLWRFKGVVPRANVKPSKIVEVWTSGGASRSGEEVQAGVTVFGKVGSANSQESIRLFFTPEQARELAGLLLNHAESAEAARAGFQSGLAKT